MNVSADSREVSLGIPAKPEYLVLVRLALSAVCRLTPLAPDEVADEAKGLRVLHLSATAFGGGVSEILFTLIPLMRDVGIEAEWQVIMGREEFFNATKLLHNALQGNPHDLTDDEWATWLRYNEL